MSHNLVRCRPAPDNWGIAGLFAVLGALLFGTPWWIKSDPKLQPTLSTTPLWMQGLGIAALCWLPALGAAAWMLLTETQADAKGLRWRRLWRWKTVVWSEVNDYYDEAKPQRRQHAVLETKAGRLRLDKHWYKSQDFQAMRHLVEQRATWARAKGWGFYGTRPEDGWPQTFAYEPAKTHRSVRSSQFLQLLGVALILALTLWRADGLWSDFTQNSGWLWDVAGLAIFGLLLAMVPLLTSFLLQERLRQERQHERERIVVTLDGICFEAGRQRIQARWEEVTDYFITTARRGGLEMPGDLTVVTAHGRFAFSQSLAQGAQLRQIIKHYATQASAQEWRNATSDMLGAAAEQWSGVQPGVGAKIYHYRNRTSRAMLWLPATYAFVITCQIPLAYYGLGNPKTSNVTVNIIISSLVWLGTGWGWWRYYRAAIEIDEEGITQHTLFKKKHIAWAEAQEYKYHKADLLSGATVRDARTRLWISAFISDFADLQAQIKRRAIHCHSDDWDSL